MGIYCTWKRKIKNREPLAVLSCIFWKLNHVHGTASLSASLSHNRSHEFLSLIGNHWHDQGHSFWMKICPYLMPFLFHSLRLTSLIILMHESIHLSFHLFHKPPRRYRTPVQIDTSPFQEQCSSPLLVEDFHLLSRISLHWLQWFQDMAGSGSFSRFSDEK